MYIVIGNIIISDELHIFTICYIRTMFETIIIIIALSVNHSGIKFNL